MANPNNGENDASYGDLAHECEANARLLRLNRIMLTDSNIIEDANAWRLETSAMGCLAVACLLSG